MPYFQPSVQQLFDSPLQPTDDIASYMEAEKYELILKEGASLSQSVKSAKCFDENVGDAVAQREEKMKEVDDLKEDVVVEEGERAAIQRRRFYQRWFNRMAPGSLRGSIYLLINSALGAGILALPYAVSLIGIIPAFTLLIVCAFFAGTTCYILFMSTNQFNAKTYYEVMRKCLGRNAGIAVDCVILLNCVGSSVAFFVFLGDFIPDIIKVFNIPAIFYDRFIVLTVCFVIMWLLSIQSLLGAMKIYSLFCVISILTISLIVIVKVFTLFPIAAQSYDILYIKMDMNFFTCFSIILFSYSQHMNVSTIAYEMGNPTKARAFKVVLRSFILEAILYSAFSFAGYLSWLGGVQQDFIKNYNVNDVAVLISRILLSLVLIFTVPNNVIVARKSFGSLYTCIKEIVNKRRSGAKSTKNMADAQLPLLDNTEKAYTIQLNDDSELPERENSSPAAVQIISSYSTYTSTGVEMGGNAAAIIDADAPADNFQTDSPPAIYNSNQLQRNSTSNDYEGAYAQYIGSTFLLSVSYILAVITTDIAFVVSLVGGTCASSLIGVFPSLVYLYGPVGRGQPLWLRYTLFALILSFSLIGYAATIIQLIPKTGAI